MTGYREPWDAPGHYYRLELGCSRRATPRARAPLVQVFSACWPQWPIRLMVYPVPPEGKRLFGSTTKKKRMRLRASRLVGDGVEILIYEPVRSAVRSARA